MQVPHHHNLYKTVLLLIFIILQIGKPADKWMFEHFPALLFGPHLFGFHSCHSDMTVNLKLKSWNAPVESAVQSPEWLQNDQLWPSICKWINTILNLLYTSTLHTVGRPLYLPGLSFVCLRPVYRLIRRVTRQQRDQNKFMGLIVLPWYYTWTSFQI